MSVLNLKCLTTCGRVKLRTPIQSISASCRFERHVHLRVTSIERARCALERERSPLRLNRTVASSTVRFILFDFRSKIGTECCGHPTFLSPRVIELELAPCTELWLSARGGK